MIPQLSEDQRRALDEHGNAPITVVDPATNVSGVLMRAEQSQGLAAHLDGGEEVDPRDFYPLIERCFLQAGWDDPAMDVYDYDANKPASWA